MDKTVLRNFAIESRKDLMEKIDRKIKLFYVDEEFKKDNIEINIEGKDLNDYLFIYTFIDMLKNNEIEIKFNNNVTKRQIEYLNKLIVK